MLLPIVFHFFSYAITMLFNSICILYFVFDGILRERREELMAFFVASLLVAAYSTYDYFMACDHAESECLARMIVSLVVQPFNVGFGLLLVNDFNWLAYKVRAGVGWGCVWVDSEKGPFGHRMTSCKRRKNGRR